MRKYIRFLTAITMVGICVFPIAWGLSIVRFSLAMANMSSSENRADTIETLMVVPGIASTVLQPQLMKKIDPSDSKAANSRREALSAIVSVKPLSSIDWLSLSGMQLTTDQPMERVLEALMLSTLTGPNESYVMADRGIFGASLWEDLSPDLRRRAAMDLAAGEMPDPRKFQAVLSTKSEGVRNEIRMAILANGLSVKEAQRRLGY